MSTFYDISNTTKDPLKIIAILILLALIVGIIYYTLEPTIETALSVLEY